MTLSRMRQRTHAWLKSDPDPLINSVPPVQQRDKSDCTACQHSRYRQQRHPQTSLHADQPLVAVRRLLPSVHSAAPARRTSQLLLWPSRNPAMRSRLPPFLRTGMSGSLATRCLISVPRMAYPHKR